MDYKDYKCNCKCRDMDELDELFEDLGCHDDYDCGCGCGCCEDPRKYCKRPEPKPMPKKGTIEVQSLLGCSDGEPICGVPVELYRIDCNTGFELIDCKYTDRCGKAVFKCLEDGLYAVKQPVDPCYFQAPEYYPCYEVCISPRNKFGRVCIINNLRKRENCNRPPIRCRCKSEWSCR